MQLEGKKVLVTGADGFIGSHLTEMLVEQGCVVRAMSLYNSFGRNGWLDVLPPSIAEEIEIVPSDIRDSRLVEQSMKGIEVVFHLAAWGGVPFSFSAPQTYIDTNVTGTSNILLAARDVGIERFLHTSTSEIYGTPAQVPISETFPRQPQSPYAASKVAADAIAESYAAAYDLPIVICRPFNTYGPRQSDRAVIPTIIGQLLSGVDELKLGDTSPTRDLTFVKDTAAGMIALCEADEAIGENVNLGVGEEVSIYELAHLIMEVTGREALIVRDEQRIRPGKSEVQRLLSDNTRIKQLTGWQPEISLKEGLHKTVEWLAHHMDTLTPEKYAV
ncbi:MAG: GDP-mannose 4,6-dehydratase [Planctomycetes bacterium]|nr:GDP-mannose 4,6-dehydratase [Planctomycetota bacterium]